MFIIAGCLLSQNYSTGAAATAFMFLFMDCFTMGILPVSWSYSAEIQPLRVRNKSMAVGVFSHWLSNVCCCSALDIAFSKAYKFQVRRRHGHTNRPQQH